MRGASRNEDWPPHDFEVFLGQKASIVPNVEENCLLQQGGQHLLFFCSPALCLLRDVEEKVGEELRVDVTERRHV